MGDMLDYVSELRERNRVLESTVQELKDSIVEKEEECADKINCLEWKLYYVEQALSDLRPSVSSQEAAAVQEDEEHWQDWSNWQHWEG